MSAKILVQQKDKREIEVEAPLYLAWHHDRSTTYVKILDTSYILLSENERGYEIEHRKETLFLMEDFLRDEITEEVFTAAVKRFQEFLVSLEA